MYAVIRTGGKQYRVAEGDVVRIEKLPGEVGSEVTFAEVLWVGGTESPPRTSTAACCTSGRRRKAGRVPRAIGSPTPK